MRCFSYALLPNVRRSKYSPNVTCRREIYFDDESIAHSLFLIPHIDLLKFTVGAARGSLRTLIAFPEISLPEAESRVENVQRQNTSGNNGALQANEVFLRHHQMATPALAQLRNTIHTPREDAQRRERQRDDKAPKLEAGAELRVSRIEGAGGTELADAAPGADGEVGAEDDEDEQGGALEAEAGEHDVVAGLRVLALVRGRRRHAAAQRLQHQREEVARDEDLRVALRRQTRVRGPECAHDAGQAEVQPCCVEGRCDG